MAGLWVEATGGHAGERVKLFTLTSDTLRVFFWRWLSAGGSPLQKGLAWDQVSRQSSIAYSRADRRLGYQICKRGRADYEVDERGRDLHAFTIELHGRVLQSFEDNAAFPERAVAGRCRLALYRH